jgi:hypothetical protein
MSDTVTVVETTEPVKKVRKYSGPPKGSEEAKDRMAKVRAAQYAKNNLVYAKSKNN